MASRNTRILLIAGAIGTTAVLTSLWLKHDGDATATAAHQSAVVGTPLPLTAEAALRAANVSIDGLTVTGSSDIVVLRGTASEATAIAEAERVVRAAGVQRVANLIQLRQGRADDDIRREAERELAQNRSFDDCRLTISCERGVLRVSGSVRSEMQTDAIRAALRRVRGVQRIETDLQTR